eukprot:5174878-Pleurochrysis_carterae.AAC.2
MEKSIASYTVMAQYNWHTEEAAANMFAVEVDHSMEYPYVLATRVDSDLTNSGSSITFYAFRTRQTIKSMLSMNPPIHALSEFTAMNA